MEKLISRSAIMSHLKKWNLTRVVQLVIGAVFFLSGSTDGDYTLAGVGVLFLLMAFLNTGCGAMSNGTCEIRNEEKKR